MSSAITPNSFSLGSSAIWSDKLKSYIIGTLSNGETEVMLCHRGADGTKSDGGIAYRFLITILR